MESINRLGNALNIRNVVKQSHAASHFIRENNHNAKAHNAHHAIILPWEWNEYTRLVYLHDGRNFESNELLLEALKLAHSGSPDKGYFGSGGKFAPIALAERPHDIEVLFFSYIKGELVVAAFEWEQGLNYSIRLRPDYIKPIQEAMSTESLGWKWTVGYSARVGKARPDQLEELPFRNLPIKLLQDHRRLDPTAFDGSYLTILQRTVGGTRINDVEPATLEETVRLAMKDNRGIDPMLPPLDFDQRFLPKDFVHTVSMQKLELTYTINETRYVVVADYEVRIKIYPGFHTDRLLLVDYQGVQSRKDETLTDRAYFYAPSVAGLARLVDRDRVSRFETDPICVFTSVKPFTDALEVVLSSTKNRAYDPHTEDWESHQAFKSVMAFKGGDRKLDRRPWVVFEVLQTKIHSVSVVGPDGRAEALFDPVHPDASASAPEIFGGVSSLFMAIHPNTCRDIMEQVISHVRTTPVMKRITDTWVRAFPLRSHGAIPLPMSRMSGVDMAPRVYAWDATQPNRRVKIFQVDAKKDVLISEPNKEPKAGFRLNDARTRGVQLEDNEGGCYTLAVKGFQEYDRKKKKWVAISEEKWRPNRNFSPSRNIYLFGPDGKEFRLDARVLTPTLGTNGPPQERYPGNRKPVKADIKNDKPSEDVNYLLELNPEIFYGFVAGQGALPNGNNVAVKKFFVGWDYRAHSSEYNRVVTLHNHIRKMTEDAIKYGLTLDMDADMPAARECYGDGDDKEVDLNTYIADTIARSLILSDLGRELMNKIDQHRSR